MGEETINQHYVPRTYLKRFANQKEQIWVYDKHQGKKFQTHVKNIAAERYFYDTDHVGQVTGDKQFVEKYLCNAEGAFDALMRTLPGTFNSRNFRGIQQKDRHFLSAYMTLQMLRTKESRITMQQQVELFQELIIRQCEKHGIKPEDHPQFNGGDPRDLARDVQARALLDGGMIQRLAKCLLGHYWVVVKIFPGETFLTSDEPVVLRPHVRHPWRSMSGVGSEGIEIGFPLDPRYMIVLYERTHFPFVAAQESSVLRQQSSENAIYHNYMQILYSNQYVFSAKDDFSFVETVLKAEPHLAEPSRVRVATNHDDQLGRDSGLHSPLGAMRRANRPG